MFLKLILSICSSTGNGNQSRGPFVYLKLYSMMESTSWNISNEVRMKQSCNNKDYRDKSVLRMAAMEMRHIFTSSGENSNIRNTHHKKVNERNCGDCTFDALRLTAR